MIGVVPPVEGGVITPLRALPPGTSAGPPVAGAGMAVCGPLLSGAGCARADMLATTPANTKPVTAS